MNEEEDSNMRFVDSNRGVVDLARVRYVESREKPLGGTFVRLTNGDEFVVLLSFEEVIQALKALELGSLTFSFSANLRTT